MATVPLAITMGDPAGIGAEITVKALEAREIERLGPVIVVGSLPVLEEARRVCGTTRPIVRIDGQADARVGRVNVLHVDVAGVDSPVAWGDMRAAYGDAAYQYVARSIEEAMAGRVAAVVTAPLNKEALHLGGHRYAGHTEIFTDLTGTTSSCMMLIHGDMRVAHVTTHVALRRVPDLVTAERVHAVIKLTHDALRSFGIADPAIGVAGLNPHCGEGGLFGSEDDERIRPAIERARQEGIRAEGPIPGDTIFVKARAGAYDAAIAMFHDQGHVAVKLLGFTVDRESGRWTSVSGVNVTLGLPIVRTSVDHGTAFDIAGTGQASSQSMVEALEVAARLAGHGS
jgi:4-hydroxythreonine-4-phosphate dehydrogenase